MLGRRGRGTPQGAFTDEIRGLLLRIPGVSGVDRRGDLRLTVHRSGHQGPLEVYLENLFAEVAGVGSEERQARIGQFLVMASRDEGKADWPDASASLMPGLKGIGWVAQSATRGAKPVAWTPFAPFVVKVTAVDQPTSMSFVTEDDLGRWGVAAAEIEERAVANLGSSELPLAESEAVPGAFHIVGPDGYASSWLAVPGLFDAVADAVGGPALALVPSRDTFCLVPLDDRDRVTAALAWAEEVYTQAPRRLSPVPYVAARSDGAVAVWQPPPDPGLVNAVARAERILALYEYDEQRAVLADLFERTGEDVFVAKLLVAEQPDGRVVSRASWAKGVNNGLLPRADLVMLGGEGVIETLEVPWEAACTIAADFIEAVPGMEPARIRIVGWPEPVMAELRAAAV